MERTRIKQEIFLEQFNSSLAESPQAVLRTLHPNRRLHHVHSLLIRISHTREVTYNGHHLNKLNRKTSMRMMMGRGTILKNVIIIFANKGGGINATSAKKKINVSADHQKFLRKRLRRARFLGDHFFRKRGSKLFQVCEWISKFCSHCNPGDCGCPFSFLRHLVDHSIQSRSMDSSHSLVSRLIEDDDDNRFDTTFDFITTRFAVEDGFDLVARRVTSLESTLGFRGVVLVSSMQSSSISILRIDDLIWFGD